MNDRRHPSPLLQTHVDRPRTIVKTFFIDQPPSDYSTSRLTNVETC